MIKFFINIFILLIAIYSSLSAAIPAPQQAPMISPNVSVTQTTPQQVTNITQNVQPQATQNPVSGDQALGDISNIVATDHAIDQHAFDQFVPGQQNQTQTQTQSQQAQQTPSSIPAGAQVEKISQEKENPDEPTDIYLNFENASLGSVLNYLAEQKKINVLPIKELEDTKVTLTTRTPLTLTRAWNILLTLLELNNLSIVKVGNLYRVVASKDNGQQPLPTYSSATGTEPEDLPDNDMVVRYVYYFKNIKTEMAKGILSKMVDETGIIENKDLNALVIKERCLNIKAAMKVVKALDMGGLREEIAIIPLKWANATTIETLFKDISGSDAEDKTIRFLGPTSQKEKAYFSSATKIIADPIQNNLILLGTSKNLNRVKNFIYKYIDVPIGDADSRLHVKEIRYAKAEDLKPIIEDIIKPPKGTSEKAVVSEGGYKVFEDVVIAAETADLGDGKTGRAGGNRLIIACNRDDWTRLEEFIDKLDKPQPQIAIEVMIISITASLNQALGANQFLLKGKAPGLGINSGEAGLQFNNLAKPIPAPTTPTPNTKDFSYLDLALKGNDLSGNSTLITLGRATLPGQDRNTADNIWAIIQSIYDMTNAHVISQPFLVANNYQECTVSIGETRNIQGPLEAGTVNLQPKQDVIAKPTKQSIKLTPYINSTGNVDLKIEVILETFVGELGSDTGGNTNTNSVVTRASMASGEVLVLGGLTNTKLSDTTYKTPILGDLPFLGTFFRSKNKTKTDQNLYVFIRPSIIKPRFEGNPDEYTQLKLDYAKYQLIKNDTYARETDPIQRWFFKPSNQSVKQKLSDARRGVLRPIDDFAYGKERPMTVNMQEDPYFKVSESIAKFKHQREIALAKKHARVA